MKTTSEKKIILVTGGQRSGKSSFAEKLTLSLSDAPIYIATSRIWDEEHRRRIEHHQAHRAINFFTIEEEKQLTKHDVTNRVVVIDCVTLWATNFFFDEQDVDRTINQTLDEFEAFTEQNAIFIFVTNEIGLGGVSEHSVQRQFTDVLGRINQHIAIKADEAYLLISGLTLKIKG